MKTIYLNPAMNTETVYPVGTVLKPSHTLVKAALGEFPAYDVYVKVTRDPRDFETCRNCFLRKVSNCHTVFSCIGSGKAVILHQCNESGELI